LKLINNEVESESLSGIRSSLKAVLGLPEDANVFPGRVEEMTRLVRPAERELVLQDALHGKLSIIVSSDRMARGMDLPNIAVVINYDCPKEAKTYVHRAGRTARAHRSGMCLTLLKSGQNKDFNKIQKSIVPRAIQTAKEGDIESVSEVTRNDAILDCFVPVYISNACQPLYDSAIKLLPSLLEKV
jgi:superfamily II DNA or RNA helicase